MNNSLLILGAGAHGIVVKEVAEACGYRNISFLDDKSSLAIGKIEDLDKFTGFSNVFVSIGVGRVRNEMIVRAQKLGFHVPSLVHPTAYVSPSANIGYGTLIEPKAIINSNAYVGNGCIVSVGAIIDHNAQVNNYAQVNAGCIVKSSAKIEKFSKLEVGQIVYK